MLEITVVKTTSNNQTCENNHAARYIVSDDGGSCFCALCEINTIRAQRDLFVSAFCSVVMVINGKPYYRTERGIPIQIQKPIVNKIKAAINEIKRDADKQQS